VISHSLTATAVKDSQLLTDMCIGECTGECTGESTAVKALRGIGVRVESGAPLPSPLGGAITNSPRPLPRAGQCRARLSDDTKSIRESHVLHKMLTSVIAQRFRHIAESRVTRAEKKYA